MSNIILVIIQNKVSDTDAAILRDRVKALGKYFLLDDYHIFVETSLTTKDVHQNIIGTDLQESGVIEILLKDTGYGIWGRAKAGLWDWLEKPT